MRQEEALLRGLLAGSLPLQPALEWALASGDAAPPPGPGLPDGLGTTASPTRAQPLPLRPVDLRTAILNHVREQAELILAAAEQEAGPSHPPTPDAQGRGAVAAPAAAALPRPLEAPAPAAGGTAQRRQAERQAAQMQRVSRRLEPGLLDESNFPRLGPPAPKPQAAVGPSPRKKKQGAKRTIVPAKVEGAAALPADPSSAAAFAAVPLAAVASPAAAATAAAAAAGGSTQLPLSPPPIHVALQRADQATPPPAQAPRDGRGALAAEDGASPAHRLLGAAVAAGKDGGANPTRRRVQPTRIEGSSSLQVNQSFLVSPEPVALQQVRTPTSRTPTATAAAAGSSRLGAGARAPLQLTPAEEQQLCVHLSFDGGGGDSGSSAPAMQHPTAPLGRPSAGAPALAALVRNAAGRGPPGCSHAGEAPERLGLLMGGMSLGTTDSAQDRRLAAAVQQQQQQAVVTGGDASSSSSTAAVPSAWGRPQQGPPGEAARAAPAGSASLSAWPALGQQQVQRQPEQRGSGGEAQSYASAANHSMPNHASPPQQWWPGAAAAPSGIDPRLRSRLESGTKGASSSGSWGAGPSPTAAPATEGRAAASGNAGPGTPASAASLGGPEGTPGSAPAPKFPSPMEAVFRRLDAKAGAAQAAAGGAAVGGIAGPAAPSRPRPNLTAAAAAAASAIAGPVASSQGHQAPSAAAAAPPGDSGEYAGPPIGHSGGAAPSVSIAAQQPQPASAAALAEPPQPAVELCAAAARLAELHSGLLRSSSALALAAELDLLLNLLAVGAAVTVDPQLAHLTLLWCGELAQQYACTVLQAAGSLVRGLSPKLLGELVELPLVRARFPRLLGAMRASLDHSQAVQIHTERAYDQVRSTGILSLFGLPAFTNDGRRTRPHEEQRRLNNRESCRDEWFALMKEAAAEMHSFSGRQLVGGGSGGSSRGLAPGGSDRLSEIGSRAGGPGGDEGSVLQGMQSAATDLLRRLRPDNFPAFAELFVAAVLQAAATGERETIMDEELSRLAKKNLSKFQQLNQRMQAGQGGMAGPSRGGAARLQQNQPTTLVGFGRQQGQQRGAGGGGTGGPRPRPGKGSGGAEEGLAASLQVIAEFPQAQRLYVMFLEAADSHRLNSCLIRCMAAKLKALTGGFGHSSGGSSSGGSEAVLTPTVIGERAVATSTLAGFLSYLCFTHAGGGALGGGKGHGDGSFDGSHPLDVRAALEAAAAEGASLAWAVPWAVRYLWFLGYEEAGASHTPYFRAVLARLQQLRLSAALTPAQPRFGLAAFCLRSLLDQFAERMGPQLMPAGLDAAAEAAAAAGTHGRAGSLAAALAGCDALLERRYVQLCCPVLEHAQQLFRGRAAGAAGGGGGSGAQAQAQRRVKTIRPTAPAGHAVARVALQVPAALQLAVDGGQDVVKLRLQRAFLEQYSTEEHRVKLKEVVDYVADVVGFNAASSAIAALAQPAVDAAAAQLTGAAEGVAVSLLVEGQLSPGLEPAVRLYVENQAEQLIAATSSQVLQQGQQRAEGEIQAHAVRAMLALTPPGLGDAVVGTAAAIVAEAAAAACAQRLLSQVPSLVRKGVTAHIDAVMAAVRKGRLAQMRAEAEAAQQRREAVAAAVEEGSQQQEHQGQEQGQVQQQEQVQQQQEA